MALSIIDENKDYIVVHKPAGLATQTARLGEKDLVSEVRNHLFLAGDKNSSVSVINRLDQPVEGLVLIAKNEKAAAILSRQLTENKIEKYYTATVYGHLQEKEGTLEDYLVKDGRTNLSRVSSKNDKQAKKAVLEYKVTESDEMTDTVQIHLITGRHHQIRVQFSNAGFPLLGDRKYGSSASMEYSNQKGVRTVSLKAYKLSFMDTLSKERKTYSI